MKREKKSKKRTRKKRNSESKRRRKRRRRRKKNKQDVIVCGGPGPVWRARILLRMPGTGQMIQAPGLQGQGRK